MTTTIVGTNQLVQIICGGGGWEDSVFKFLLSVTEINTYKIYHHFKECLKRSILDFRLELSFLMILNGMPGSFYNPEDFK